MRHGAERNRDEGRVARAGWGLLAAAFVSLACAAGARAADFHINTTTLAQGYEYGAANGEVVARRRIAQFVQVNGYNLLPDNQLTFVSSFRLDADFGIGATDNAIPGPQYLRQSIRELQTANMTLLYGYLAGRNLWRRVDFDAGRQFVVDLVDYFHFDGVRVAVGTPWRFGVEAYAGWEVRAGASLGASAFDLPGVAEASDRAPTFGASLYLKDMSFGAYSLAGKVTYRKTQASRSLDSCAQRPDDRADCDRLSTGSMNDDVGAVRDAFGRDLVVEERLSTSLQLRLKDVRLWGGFSYNLVNAWFDDVLFGGNVRLFKDKLLVETEYLRTRPRFDADSIFNVFATNAFDDVRAKVSWTFPKGHELYVRAYVRFFHAQQTAGGSAVNGALVGEPTWAARGAVVGARLNHGARDYTTFDLLVQDGYGGYLFGGDAWSRFFFKEGKLALDGRLLVLRFDDDRQPNLNGITLTLQGGARWQLHKNVGLHLIVEESTNRLYSSIFRVYAMLDLGVWL